jgi:hypothetical protein
MSQNNRRVAERGIRFRINKTEPLIIIQGLVNGKGPYAFVVDTGASMTVVSPLVARRAGICLKGTKAKAAGVDGFLDATITTLRSLRIGALEATNLKVAIVSLAVLNRSTRLKLGGIIGYNILKHYQVIIDYPSKRIFFQSPAAEKRCSTQLSTRPA